MNDDIEICTISIGVGALDDDYTFYESGKIKRFFDQSMYKLNQETWIESKDISEHIKKKLIDKCGEKIRGRIQSILLPQ